MMKNHNLAKAISEMGWRQLRTMLEYKTDWQGKNLVVIGRFEPSSKICSNCGNHKKDLKLSDRTNSFLAWSHSFFLLIASFCSKFSLNSEIEINITITETAIKEIQFNDSFWTNSLIPPMTIRVTEFDGKDATNIAHAIRITGQRRNLVTEI